MSQIKILVVEDEILIADNICDTLTDLGYFTLEPALNYTEAILSLKTEAPDIVILDINLSGEKSGIDIAEVIKSQYDIPFIFLTSNADKNTVSLAKKVQPKAFLVKPFTQEELYSSIEIALSNHIKHNLATSNNDKSKKVLFLKEKGIFIKIKLEDILYIKSDHVYIEVILSSEKKHVIRTSLNDILTKLNKNFIRIHRSYIVNSNYIDQIQSNKLFLNNSEIPIGKSYKNIILQKININ